MAMGQMQKTIKMNVSMFTDLWPTQVVDEVQKVMEKGARDGKEGWEGQRCKYHLGRAVAHISHYMSSDESEDHLAHAFTRLMMAVAIERGYVEREDADA